MLVYSVRAPNLTLQRTTCTFMENQYNLNTFVCLDFFEGAVVCLQRR